MVEEPSEDKAVAHDARRRRARCATHHGVQLLDEAIRSAVTAFQRYIPDRQLPDKAVSLLDTACARVAISQHAVPPPVEDARRTIESLELGARPSSIASEAVGIDTGDRKSVAELALAEVRASVSRSSRRAGRPRAGARRADPARSPTPSCARQPIDGGDKGNRVDRAEAPRAPSRGLERELAAMQGESPLILPSVDEQAVAAVVSDWTGIPVGRMVRNEIETVLGLADLLGKRVDGPVARARAHREAHPDRARRAREPGQADRRVPARRTLGRRQDRDGARARRGALRRRAERHHDQHERVPGGAHGLDAQGLAAGVRRLRRGRRAHRGGAARPYSVVLLDEVEKAHPDVHELFFQVFDKGWMEDGQGTRVDFKNTIILLDVERGQRRPHAPVRTGQSSCQPDDGSPEGAPPGPARRSFPPRCSGAWSIIPYYPLSDDDARTHRAPAARSHRARASASSTRSRSSTTRRSSTSSRAAAPRSRAAAG